MDRPRTLARCCVALACVGLLMPQAVGLGAHLDAAAPSPLRVAARGPVIGDVELDEQGRLHGAVVNLQGVPVADAVVVICQDGRELARTSTDALGCFTVEGLRGGTYVLAVGDSARAYRAWTANTAPPKTSQLALLIVGSSVVRGQVCLQELCCCCCDPLILIGIIGAMIAIPIIVHQDGNGKPKSD